MKKLILVLLLPLLAAGGGQSIVNTGNHRKVMAIPCVLTGATHDWPLWGSGVLCTGSVACTSGAGIITVPDTAGSLTLSSSGGGSPLYSLSQINGLAAGHYSTGKSLVAASNITTGNATTTWLAIVKPNTSGDYALTGNPAVNATFEWRISGGKQQLLVAGTVLVGAGTATLSSSNWYALAVQYNQPTGAWAFYICASGTCSSDGSGTNIRTFTNPVTSVGYANPDGAFADYLAEMAFYNSITTTGFAAYAQCKYGI